MFQVICINALGRPNEIPTTKWIKKDEVYTVIRMDYLNIQNRMLGFQLEEVSLEGCFPYLYFSSSRFRPYTQDDANAEKAVKELLETQYQKL
jgi:hypothetical protein